MKADTRRFHPWARVLALIVALPLLSPGSRVMVETFVTGLNQPRGMTFDDAGNLYVAEAGALDPRADDSVSPITNHSGRLLRIASDHGVTTVLAGLPFTHYITIGDVGASDVYVAGDRLYVLTAEGWDDRLSRSVLQVIPGEPPRPVANLLSFAFGTTPAADQLASGGVPSNPYAMAAAPDGRSLFVTDGASGTVLRVTLDGTIRRFATLPNMPPLTGLSFGPDGRLYIAMFSAMPLGANRGAIWAADADGRLALAAGKLTLPIDVAFDATGAMYVLEFSDSSGRGLAYAAGRGRLLRIERNGKRTVVLDRLSYPTAMIFSRTGDLYIAVNGAFSGAGQGTILKVRCAELNTPSTCPPR